MRAFHKSRIHFCAQLSWVWKKVFITLGPGLFTVFYLIIVIIIIILILLIQYQHLLPKWTLNKQRRSWSNGSSQQEQRKSIYFIIVLLHYILTLLHWERPKLSHKFRLTKLLRVKVLIFSYPWILTYVLGAQKNRLIETVLLSTHDICLGWEIRKLIFCYTVLN